MNRNRHSRLEYGPLNESHIPLPIMLRNIGNNHRTSQTETIFRAGLFCAPVTLEDPRYQHDTRIVFPFSPLSIRRLSTFVAVSRDHFLYKYVAESEAI